MTTKLVRVYRNKEVKIGNRTTHYEMSVVKHGDGPGATVLLVPGIITKLSGMQPLASALNELGYSTVVMAHDSIDDDCAQDVAVMAERAKNAHEMNSDSSLYLAAHSLGAIHTIHALVNYPTTQGITSGTLLMAPAGYGGVQPESALRSIVTEAMRRPDTRQVRAVVLDALSYTARAGFNLIGKIQKASGELLVDNTARLIEGGVPIGVLRYPQDVLVAPGKLGDGLRRAGFGYVFDVEAPHAGHNAHILHPNEVAESLGKLVLSLGDGGYERRGATSLRRG